MNRQPLLIGSQSFHYYDADADQSQDMDHGISLIFHVRKTVKKPTSWMMGLMCGDEWIGSISNRKGYHIYMRGPKGMSAEVKNIATQAAAIEAAKKIIGILYS